MREAYLSGATLSESGHAPAHPAAERLCLAAAPTFAIMALLPVPLLSARRICSARPRNMRHR